eukprot:1157110-Pelagomonas_calceolata.AAC.3
MLFTEELSQRGLVLWIRKRGTVEAEAICAYIYYAVCSMHSIWSQSHAHMQCSYAHTHVGSQVPPPLGVRGVPQENKSVQDIILSVDIPLRRNSMTVHFTEVLHALAGRMMGAEVPEQEECSVYSRLMNKMPKVCASKFVCCVSMSPPPGVLLSVSGRFSLHSYFQPYIKVHCGHLVKYRGGASKTSTAQI